MWGMGTVRCVRCICIQWSSASRLTGNLHLINASNGRILPCECMWHHKLPSERQLVRSGSSVQATDDWSMPAEECQAWQCHCNNHLLVWIQRDKTLWWTYSHSLACSQQCTILLFAHQLEWCTCTSGVMTLRRMTGVDIVLGLMTAIAWFTLRSYAVFTGSVQNAVQTTRVHGPYSRPMLTWLVWTKLNVHAARRLVLSDHWPMFAVGVIQTLATTAKAVYGVGPESGRSAQYECQQTARAVVTGSWNRTGHTATWPHQLNGRQQAECVTKQPGGFVSGILPVSINLFCVIDIFEFIVMSNFRL